MAVAIIGAGASGLMCAITAARNGARVTVYEQNAKAGRKLLATGNGRCNITNKNISPSNFYSNHETQLQYLLQNFSTQSCIDFFKTIDLEIIEKERGKLFPMSLHAASVVDLLVYACESLGVVIRLNTKVTSIEKKDGYFVINGKEKFKKVVIATGGISAPQLGDGKEGYRLSKNLGHSLTPLFPSLVQMVTKEKFVKTVSGVKFDGLVRVFIDGEERTSKRGDLLFTDYGISGSAILDISRVASKGVLDGKNVTLSVNLLPGFSKEKLKNFFQSRLNNSANKDITVWLEGVLHKKLAALVLKESDLTVIRTKDLKTKDLNRLIYTIQNIKLTVTDTKGFKTSEVTAGGISTKEIDPKTFKSKLVQNLYFTGEVLDVDGDCGGYNLHFAWGSGILAGQALTNR